MAQSYWAFMLVELTFCCCKCYCSATNGTPRPSTLELPVQTDGSSVYLSPADLAHGRACKVVLGGRLEVVGGEFQVGRAVVGGGRGRTSATVMHLGSYPPFSAWTLHLPLLRLMPAKYLSWPLSKETHWQSGSLLGRK